MAFDCLNRSWPGRGGSLRNRSCHGQRRRYLRSGLRVLPQAERQDRLCAHWQNQGAIAWLNGHRKAARELFERAHDIAVETGNFEFMTVTGLRADDRVEPGHRPLRKVFGVGLSRTGTTSLTRALELLGYRAVHFPVDHATQAEVSTFLRAPADPLRLSLLDSVDAITDTPIAATYRALDRAYPGSAFVLTVRDAESWLRSCNAYWQSALTRLYAGGVNARYVRLINRHVYGTEHFDSQSFTAAYGRHQAQVHTYFETRGQDLLELDVCGGEGWPKLCSFLRAERPATPFPYANASRV